MLRFQKYAEKHRAETFMADDLRRRWLASHRGWTDVLLDEMGLSDLVIVDYFGNPVLIHADDAKLLRKQRSEPKRAPRVRVLVVKDAGWLPISAGRAAKTALKQYKVGGKAALRPFPIPDGVEVWVEDDHGVKRG